MLKLIWQYDDIAKKRARVWSEEMAEYGQFIVVSDHTKFEHAVAVINSFGEKFISLEESEDNL